MRQKAESMSTEGTRILHAKYHCLPLCSLE